MWTLDGDLESALPEAPLSCFSFILISFIMDKVHSMQVYSSGTYIFTEVFFGGRVIYSK